MTLPPASKPRVGLLGLTLQFYETDPSIRQGREKWVREKLLPALAPVADVRFESAAFTREQIERQVAAFEADGVDVLLVVLLSYSTSLSAGPALQRTRLPIVIWNTQELWAVDEKYDSPALIANHGVHGTHDLCNVLCRMSVPFDYLTSHLNDARAVDELGEQLRAAAAVSRLRRGRVGLLGHAFPGMGDFGLDTTHLAATLGCDWQALSLSDFHRRTAEADADAVAGLVAQYRADYEIADPRITEADLADAARAEIALRGIVGDNRLTAYSYQFLAFGDDERTQTLPFVAACRLLAEGVGFGGEGDMISALFSTAINQMRPPAGFSEIFTIDFAGNGVLLSHMGESNPAMAGPGQKVRIVRRDKPIVPIRGSQLTLAVTYQPGPATLAALTLGAGGRWRVIASPMRLVPFGPLDHLQVPHAKLSPPDGRDVRDFLTGYARAGGPHHLAVCFGDARRQLAAFARFIDADYTEV